MTGYRIYTSLFLIAFFALSAAAQPVVTGAEWADPGVGNVGGAPLRSEFISWDMRETAEKGDRAKNPYYMELQLAGAVVDGRTVFTARVDIPYMWLDRDLFLHSEGIPSFRLRVNGTPVGYEGSRYPSEFMISPWVTDGQNTIEIELVDGTGRLLETAAAGSPEPLVFLYSQPKLRIEDYVMTLGPDSTGKYGMLDLMIAVSNSYNFDEQVTIGYDIYSPDGKLQYYDMREMVIPGGGRDTIRYRQLIYNTAGNAWSPASPKLYHGMLTVRRDGRMTEYIPFRTGFCTTGVADGNLLRNGTPVALHAARYNAAPDARTTATQLAALKRKGINTVCPDYPQPLWFYDLCDSAGMMVVDQPGINSDHAVADRRLGGAYSNDPAWLGQFMRRTEAMYARVRNHVCIVGWSPGGAQGNGFNMYRTYRWLRENEPSRPVVYNDAAGEWNSDMAPFGVVDGAALLK